MNDSVRADIIAAPFALETLLILAQSGATHGKLADLFGVDQSYNAKGILEAHGLARFSDLSEFITPQGKELVRQLRELAGTEASDVATEAEAIRSAIRKKN